MLNGLLRLIGIGALAIAGIMVFFFVLHTVIRLVILGAIVVAVLWIIKSFGGSGVQGR